MASLSSFLTLFLEKKAELAGLFIDHLDMTLLAVLISLAIGVPLGILLTRNKTASKIVIGIANIMQSIPCIALLAFSVPVVGIGSKPAILMVIVYALLPIIKNTYTGINGIDPKTIEVAQGIGFTKWKSLFRIELPMAAPYIMSGIRISSVAAVGTMTIAAFAGAGGLGWYINLGLNSQDVNLVLLGAIPASLMALSIDFILGKLEHVITPEGLYPPQQIKNVPKKKKRRERIIVLSLCALLALLPLFAAIGSSLTKKSAKVVTVGSSNFTEALILGSVYSELIEANTDIDVEERFNLNGGVVCFNAIKSGGVDMFMEYTGSILPNYLHSDFVSTDAAKVYNESAKELKEQYNIALSAPLGFNNTYVMSVTPKIAKKYNLSSLSDLIACADKLRLGCTVEFIQRGDCLPLLGKQYGTKFLNTSGLDGSIRYQAIASGEVDVIDAFATDALLEKQKLVTLKDDLNFFPPYYAVNLIRQTTLDKYPELVPVLSKLDGLIDEQSMREMNKEVDMDGLDAQDVAHQFLVKNRLVPD